MKKLVAFLLVGAGISAFAQTEKIDTAMVSKIKKEGFDNSQVMNILGMLTDVHGPRLTNSPGYKKAAEYAKSTLQSWGLQNVGFDSWGEEFGRGWYLKKFSLQALDPVYFPVIAYPKAWSPGIKGNVQADVVYLDVKKEEDLQRYKGKLKGKVVLFSLPTPVKPGFEPDAKRFDDTELLEMANSGVQETGGGGRFRPSLGPQSLAYAKWDLCMKEGVVAVLEASPASRLEDGTLTASAASVPYPPETPFNQRLSSRAANAPKILPQIVVAAEHYNRMVRQAEKGLPVKVDLTMETVFTPAESGFNVIAEIPGTDLKDEVVMIGAHLDSWHSGTGTTDNASGSAVMMEAMRILKSLGTNPRRTIRIGLWGGEEQGLIGSRSYVKRTYGERLDRNFPYDSIKLTPAAEKFSVYFNMDNGTGKYRGVYLQGNQNAMPVFRSWIKPFEKLGAATLTLQNTSGTDHLAFDAIGLPGFQFIQDPIEYFSRTHHTSMDLYDKAIEADLKHNAVMTAAFAWIAANRDEKFPRK
ncbi:MAG: M20/M25/M40 family metallo-hydrolase [Cyclobacteriaceae bacterium]